MELMERVQIFESVDGTERSAGYLELLELVDEGLRLRAHPRDSVLLQDILTYHIQIPGEILTYRIQPGEIVKRKLREVDATTDPRKWLAHLSLHLRSRLEKPGLRATRPLVAPLYQLLQSQDDETRVLLDDTLSRLSNKVNLSKLYWGLRYLKYAKRVQQTDGRLHAGLGLALVVSHLRFSLFG